MKQIDIVSNMDSESLTYFIRNFENCNTCPIPKSSCNTDCSETIKKWLESEVEE